MSRDRLHILFPEKHLFETRMEIRVGNLNYGNHLANEQIASFVNECRVRFLKSLGYASELEIDGNSLIMADYCAKFLAEGKHAEWINCKVYVNEMSRSSFKLYVKMVKEEAKVDLAHVKTSMIFYNYSTQKVTTAPASFVEHIAKLNAE